MQLLDFQKDNFTFKVTVSSGTYIRSLINDIGKKLDIFMTMEELERTRVGNYKLEDANNLNNLEVVSLLDALDIKKVECDEVLLKKVSNGVQIKNIYNEKMVMFVKNNQPISIYQDDNGIMKSYRVFNYK